MKVIQTEVIWVLVPAGRAGPPWYTSGTGSAGSDVFTQQAHLLKTDENPAPYLATCTNQPDAANPSCSGKGPSYLALSSFSPKKSRLTGHQQQLLITVETIRVKRLNFI